MTRPGSYVGCPECGGAGFFDATTDEVSPGWDRCPTCRGEGVVCDPDELHRGLLEIQAEIIAHVPSCRTCENISTEASCDHALCLQGWRYMEVFTRFHEAEIALRLKEAA